MNRWLSAAVAAVALALCTPLHAAGAHDHHHAHHQALDVAAWPAPPKLSIKLHRDAASGWNLQLITENSRFAPEHVNQASGAGEGHAHVYVDGRKLSRLYGHWYHLTGIGEGVHTVRVSLNANDHSELVLEGVPVGDEVVIGE